MEEVKLGFEKEFVYDGKAAKWPPGSKQPQLWGEEMLSVRIPKGKPTDRSYEPGGAAMSNDEKLLAVTVDSTILVYELPSLDQVSIIVDNGTIGYLEFIDNTVLTRGTGAKYALMSSGASGDPYGDYTPLRTWLLDASGRLVPSLQVQPLPVDQLVDAAMDTLSHRLRDHDSIEPAPLAELRKDLVQGLDKVDRQNRVKKIPGFQGIIPGFCSKAISHDGLRILAGIHGETTQHGMRPPEKLPQIVVLDSVTLEKKAVLAGHTDAIMWASWSLDDKIIATASWDRTFCLWDATTGELKHAIGPTYGQNWAGGFLPDGKHVFLSGTNTYAIYDVKTAKEVARLRAPIDVEFDSWLRYIAVHPIENIIVIQNGRSLLLWRPFHEKHQGPELQEIFALERDDERFHNMFGELTSLEWTDHGKKLVAYGYENTVYVWDKKKNLKWRFQRPEKIELGDREPHAFYTKRDGEEYIVAVNGDDYIRLWKL